MYEVPYLEDLGDISGLRSLHTFVSRRADLNLNILLRYILVAASKSQA